jgi:hypothetical protein
MKTSLQSCAVLLLFVNVSLADETTFCNFYITSLPYTIATQGHYCFDRNLSTAATTGNAITINSDFVVLDLNNFKLGGGAAGPSTLANGVYGLNHKNITIRNGNVRGFYRGIFLDDSSTDGANGQGCLVENMLVDQNMLKGISVNGTGCVIRHNQVVSNGATPLTASEPATGIHIAGGSGAQVFDNAVLDMREGATVGSIGILLGGLNFAISTAVERNFVANPNITPSSTGIGATGNGILIFNNRIVAYNNGIFFDIGFRGAYRDNATYQCSTPYAIPFGSFPADYGNNQ